MAAKSAPKPSTKPGKSPNFVRVSGEALPRKPLRDVLILAETLHKTYAGKSAAWDELADAAKLAKPEKSNETKYKFWGATAYGVLKKEEGAGQVFSLAETGRKIVAPTYDGEEREAIRKAVLTPTILSKFYSDYNGHAVPGDAHFPNVLETKFGVPRGRTAEAIEIIKDNGKFAGILVANADGGLEVRLGAAGVAGPSATLTSDTAAPLPEAEQAPGGAPQVADWDKVCFYITPIGDDGSESRKHADMMLKHLLDPVAKDHGLQVVRADKIDRSGLITQQIFDHLARSRLCVADLSFNNANAFYELGVRHTCKRATIQVIRKGDRIPFDVSQGRTIVVDTSDVYTVMDRFESARRELSEHIKHALNGKPDAADDNPVNVYLPGLKITMTQ
ncbi:hypothetical protein RAS1_32880 [Phycisphaerae bacterium RAS1]|nr:hypothetical protein RAS1_32880 [Phycisphaerae bacterium RAS1]